MIKKLLSIALLCSSSLFSFQEEQPFLIGEAKMNLQQFYKNKSVLITGGCGFIGSHLAEKLVQLGARVSIIDDLSTGDLSNIETFKDTITFCTIPGMKMIECFCYRIELE